VGGWGGVMRGVGGQGGGGGWGWCVGWEVFEWVWCWFGVGGCGGCVLVLGGGKGGRASPL